MGICHRVFRSGVGVRDLEMDWFKNKKSLKLWLETQRMRRSPIRTSSWICTQCLRDTPGKDFSNPSLQWHKVEVVSPCSTEIFDEPRRRSGAPCQGTHRSRCRTGKWISPRLTKNDSRSMNLEIEHTGGRGSMECTGRRACNGYRLTGSSKVRDIESCLKPDPPVPG